MPTEDVTLRIKVEGDFEKFKNFLKKKNFEDDGEGFVITDSKGKQLFAMRVESEDNFTDSGMSLFGTRNRSVRNPRAIRDWFAKAAKRNGCSLSSFFIRELSMEMGGIFRYWVWPFTKPVADFFFNSYRPYDDDALNDTSISAQERNQMKKELQAAKKDYDKRLAGGEVLGLYIDGDEFTEAMDKAEDINEVEEQYDEALKKILKGENADCTVFYIKLEGDEVQDEDIIRF